MKVLVIPSWYATNRNEIAGVFVREQCKSLFNRGIEVNVLFADLYLFNILNPNKWFNSSFIVEKGVTVFKLNGFSFPKRSLWLSNFWSKIYLKVFEQYLQSNTKPDIVHAHSYFAGMVALVIKRKYGIPYVITEHHSGFTDRSICGWHLSIVREVLNNADSIIALNNNLKNELLKHTVNKIEVIPNLIDTKVFNYIGRQPTSIFRLLAVGFLIKRKGHDLVLRAMDQLVNSRKLITKVELIIIGEGNERNNLEKMIVDLDLKENVKLVGNIDHDLLPEYLSSSNAFISASYAETQGVAITQALCSGLPVISTYVGGLPEIINNRNGILIQTGDVNELANAIEFMINNYSEYNRKAISEEAMKIYDPDIITEKLIRVYTDLIA